MEAKFYDPSLDDEDITLNVLGDYNANFDGPQPNELITGVLGELSSQEIPNSILTAMDQFIAEQYLPWGDSIVY